MSMTDDEGMTHYVGDGCEPDGHRCDPDRPDDGLDVMVLDDPDGWARFPCAECDNDLAVGDEVVMVEVDLVMVHPAHRDRRKCR